MTGVWVAVVLMAALFAGFGLVRRGARAGQACDGCPGGCTECAALTGEDTVEVERGRK
ncbi:MAG TPA: hypothetical protein VLA20_11380 [Vicinamibacterales bacterium]|nr:hypothetical protein [Vicinamibacterales bacterium]